MNAEENLGKAKKNEGKNSINYIDTMKWDKYIELSKLGDDIYNEIQRGKLSKGFPYFLQNLGNKFNREITQGTVISGTNVQSGNSILVPDPLLTYYIRRNYNSRDSNEAENLIKTLLADNDAKWKYMNFISSYIVIKVRKN
jgi:CRISPR-associated protein Csm1